MLNSSFDIDVTNNLPLIELFAGITLRVGYQDDRGRTTNASGVIHYALYILSIIVCVHVDGKN